MRRWVFILAILGLVVWQGSETYYYYQNQKFFDQIHGPDSLSVLPARQSTPFQIYSQGSKSRLAVLLTDPNSSWLELAHGLKSIGIPFIITQDYQQALQHKVVMIYPELNNQVFSYDAIQALIKFSFQGGSLISEGVQIKRLGQLFGFNEIKPASQENTEIRFNPGFSVSNGFKDPMEHVIKVGNKVNESVADYAYHLDAKAPLPLATYQDGTTAITQKINQNGKAYALGIDIGKLLYIGYNNREEHIARSYVNGYEPSIDVVLRLIKNIYLEGDPSSITLNTIPFGKKTAVIITHDIYSAKAASKALSYAEFEHDQKIRATYFIQTKYVHDFDDEAFFNIYNIPKLQQLSKLNMEIASNSVSHSRQFNEFPQGTGKEHYPEYYPFVKSQTETVAGTIFGELRVSRFFLDHFFKNQQIASFRPGYYSNPHSLPESLIATHYHYSSSVTANNSLTHLPFQLNYNRDYDKGVRMELPVYEFPVTIEDSSHSSLHSLLEKSLQLFEQISNDGGIYVLQITPDELGSRFKFEKEFIHKIGTTAWIGSMSDFGAWWAARDQVSLDVTISGTQLSIQLTAPVALSGLTLNIPAGWKYRSSEPSGLSVTQNERQLIIDKLNGQVKLVLEFPHNPAAGAL